MRRIRRRRSASGSIGCCTTSRPARPACPRARARRAFPPARERGGTTAAARATAARALRSGGTDTSTSCTRSTRCFPTSARARRRRSWSGRWRGTCWSPRSSSARTSRRGASETRFEVATEPTATPGRAGRRSVAASAPVDDAGVAAPKERRVERVAAGAREEVEKGDRQKEQRLLAIAEGVTGVSQPGDDDEVADDEERGGPGEQSQCEQKSGAELRRSGEPGE